MPGYVILFVVGVGGLSILDFVLSKERSTMSKVRRRQGERLFTENVIRDKLADVVENRVKPSKRIKIEESLEKAGLSLSYVDYVSYCLLSSLVMGVLFGASMKNPLLGFIFTILGYFVPAQVVGFIKNKRTQKMSKQVGSFMQMVTKRYENTKDFHKALAMTVPEFEGEEPIYSELQRTLAEMNVGTQTEIALMNFSKRTDNKYMMRYAVFYELVSNIGKDETRKDLLGQAIKQYQEDYEIKRMLKKEISGPVTEAYIMLAFVPVIAIYQMATSPDYIFIMTQTAMGRIGTAGIVTALIGITWFINNKLGAPLD